MEQTGLSGPIQEPSIDQLWELRSDGTQVGYSGKHIYLRYRAILRLLSGMQFANALNVGCGFALFDRLMPDDLNLIGIDPGRDEIAYATAWARKHRPIYAYHCASLAECDLSAESFDLIIVSEVLEHVPQSETAAILDTSARLLRSGGCLLVTVPNRRQLRNRGRRIVGLEPVLMDETHLREYDRSEANRLLDNLPFSVKRFSVANLFFPFEGLIGRVIKPESPLRDRIIQRWPNCASHFLILAIRDT